MMNATNPGQEEAEALFAECYFGFCPQCGKEDGCLNIGRAHWFVCHTHKVKWCVGENLFSSWKHEGEELWRENWQTLSAYREIEEGNVPLPFRTT